MGLDHHPFSAVYQMAIRYGAIDQDEIGSARISVGAIQLLREIESRDKEKEVAMDLVESMRLTIRRQPLIAWPFMVAIAVVFLATALNQIGGATKFILEWMGK